MDDVISLYYKNNGEKIRALVNQIYCKEFGKRAEDMDEFYSAANEAFADIIAKRRYQETKGKFEALLHGALRLAIIDEWKRQHCGKRKMSVYLTDEKGCRVLDKDGKPKRILVPDISLDAPISDHSEATIGSMVPSDFDIDAAVADFMGEGKYEERVGAYLDSLPQTTRRAVEMKMEERTVSEIRKELKLSKKEYCRHMQKARQNENLAMFTKRSNQCRKGCEMNHIIPIDVTDNYRMDKYPLGGLLDDMKDGKINKRHILQRKAFQWTERQKNKFLTRVLNGQPIPEIVICEQMIKGKKKSHLIDGLQRLSYSELFRADGIVIKSDGAEFYEIPYKEYQYDENGDICLDEEGDAVFRERIFNVLGKKFSDLPEFLKDRFNKFNINVTTYFNCTDEQIAYHIRNYNNQEGMNKSQYEFTGINIDTATRIKNISDEHPFFREEYGRYTEKNRVKGDIDKVVVESIMAVNFLNDWKKETKDSFTYVNENATEAMFASLRNTLDRLCAIIVKDSKNMFTTTNSPVWFAVFDKFKTWGEPDVRFREFLKYADDSMGDWIFEGKRFGDIFKSRNTRDKAVVVGKVRGLTALMREFFHKEEEGSCQVSEEAFIVENVGIAIEAARKDMELYNETLNDLEENTVRIGSKLLEEENRPSLLAMVAYSYETDKDLDEWMAEYARKNKTYIPDQRKNFQRMKKDFKEFSKK